jgi:FtsP/CotA-like multicopper oxidase with cupredoxin domain
MSTAFVRVSIAAAVTFGLGFALAAAGTAKPAHRMAAAMPMPAQPRCDETAADRYVGNPPSYDEYKFVAGNAHIAGAPALTGPALAAPGEKALDLHIVFGIGQIYNPTTKKCDTVTLRFYSRTDDQDPNGRVPFGDYVAPTIDITPGDTIHMTLHNDLPNDDPSCGPAAEADMDHPHCFNGTNLHTHGLWVSPTGNSDNVLLSIYPGTIFDYIYNIPPDHPAGTFWYHTHLHGSTALQVSSGMAGAIIIHGNRPPIQVGPDAYKPGDLDLLLKDSPDRTFVLQQIQYACLRNDGTYNIQTIPANGQNVTSWPCNPDQTGITGPFLAQVTGPDGKPVVNKDGKPVFQTGYEDSNGNGYGPGSWGGSNRYTSVNGVVLPTFQAAAGQVNRWRFIHGGVRDSIDLRFYRMKPALLAGIPAQGDKDFIDRQCYGDPIHYYVAAEDGLTMAQAMPATEQMLEPGYRIDALVVFPADGDYCVVDAASQAADNVWGVSKSVRLIGKVSVRGGHPVTEDKFESVIQDTMIHSAKMHIANADIQGKAIDGLKDHLKFTLFVPHPTVTKEEVANTPVEQLYFEIDTKSKNVGFLVGDAPDNMHPYDMNRIDRTLILGTSQEWNLESLYVSHPFHIHVNPFQIVAVYDPLGHDVSKPGVKDTFEWNPVTKQFDMNGPPDPVYANLQGVWKDTIWVKNVAPNQDLGPKGMYRVVTRTRYERYIGEFVLHCHILDHEDQGMMQNVQIVPPGYTGPGAIAGKASPNPSPASNGTDMNGMKMTP